MKITTLSWTLALGLITNTALGQHPQSSGCGTEQVSQHETPKALSCTKASTNYSNHYALKESFIPENANSVTKTVHVNFIVIRRANGTGNLFNDAATKLRIKQYFTNVNLNYQTNSAANYALTPYIAPPYVFLPDSKVRIVLDSIYYVNDPTPDSSLYYGSGGAVHYPNICTLQSYMSTNHPTSTRALNYYLTGGEWSGVGGFAGTDAIQSFYRRSPEMNVNTVHDWWFAFHMTHEIGHCLDLKHVYESNDQTCNPANIDFLSDAFPNVSCLPSCNVCLLPASSGDNNLMGGNADWVYASRLQMGIMHRALMTENHLQISCGTGQIRNHSTGYSTTPMEITQNETWDFTVKMYQDLVVKAGSTLTIKCVVEFVPEASLIIEPGAKVILDGGKLTNEWYYRNFWQGVQVWGTTTQHQYPVGVHTYQGLLKIINGGIIENAVNGARNWKPGDYNKIGGVITCSDAVFRNNRRAVEFVTYENFSTSNPAIKRPDLSSFSKTTFTIDNNMIGGNSNFIYHVSMWDVNGIGYSNCTFNNLNTNKVYTSYYNEAIYSIDAGYSISAGCSSFTSPCPDANLLKSTFTGFTKAIEASNSSTSRTISVDQAIFTDNLYGVVIGSLNNTAVNRSIFNIGGYTATGLSGAAIHNGIINTTSTGYKFEENKFYRTVGTTPTIYGISNISSGAFNNRIYKNEFYNITKGNYNSGTLRSSSDAYVGYQALCNRFDGTQTYGVEAVINGSSSLDGIRGYQGDPIGNISSGNTYFNITNPSIGFRNGTNWPINYYYKGSNTSPTTSGSIALVLATNANACLSSFSSDGGSSGLILNPHSKEVINAELASLTKQKTDLKYAYARLIDNGNTEQSVKNLDERFSKDASSLRDQLISGSPYISQEMILSAISKNILPEAMILEICLANPESVRGELFISKMKESSVNAIPEYIYDLIRGTWYDESSRSLLEKALGETDYQMQLRYTTLLTSLLLSDEKTDSDVLNELSRQSSVSSKFDVVEFHIEHNNYDLATKTLNGLLIKNPEDQIMFSDLDQYIALRKNVFESGRKISQMSEQEMNQLVRLTESKGKVSNLARNILCFFYNNCIEPAFESSEPTSLVLPKDVRNNSSEKLMYAVSIYPNPAIQNTNLSWNISEKLDNCKIYIYSIAGKLIHTYDIQANEGKLTIETGNLSDGVYFYSLENKGEQKSTDKFIISKSK